MESNEIMNKKYAPGKHLVAEVFDFPKVNIEICLEKMLASVPLMGCKAVKSCYSRNPDQAFIILNMSHMSLHIFEGQKYNFAYFDIFTCGDCNPRKGYDYFKKGMGFSKDAVRIYQRGRL